MVVAGRVVNRPSDGTERQVANHIGVAIVEVPPVMDAGIDGGVQGGDGGGEARWDAGAARDAGVAADASTSTTTSTTTSTKLVASCSVGGGAGGGWAALAAYGLVVCIRRRVASRRSRAAP